ncbi:MAG: thiol-disulfide oxidoreductase DCC family protein [Isosphaeraceae bacterium]
MKRLYVLHDDQCGLCRWARRWVEDQATFVEVVFLGATSEAARRTFPTLAVRDPPEELVVVSDAGEVYRGGSAWVMVLYALRDYREWALRLGSPALLPLARRGFAWASRNRGWFSRWLGLDDEELGRRLQQVDVPACDLSANSAPSPSNQGANAGGWSRAAGWRREFNL